MIVGENGAGKSTILDAIHYVLFGKPFRKIKKDQLINSINERDAVVEVEFDTNGLSYKIVRGMKPAIFEIYRDGELLNQTAAVKDYQDILERTILKMNSKTFSQIVLCSSSYTPFMQVPTNIRREIIEELLDIRVFSVMNMLLKDMISDLRTKIALNDKDIESSKELIKVKTAQLEKSTVDIEDKIRILHGRAVEYQLHILEMDIREANYKNDLQELIEKIKDESAVQKKFNNLNNIGAKIDAKIESTQNIIDFLDKNNTCPTCTQEIDGEFKQSKIEGCLHTIEETEKGKKELITRLEQLRDELQSFREIHDKITDLKGNIASAINSKLHYEREISFLKENIKQIQEDGQSDSEDIGPFQEQLKNFEIAKEELFKTKSLYELAGIILRDSGIKSKIIKQYIAVINQLVNKYLAAMDFFVKFELDENFNEKILSRHRDQYTYDSFSAGEKMRIDLALLFTWRTIARMKNSASTNLLILDEFFDASLDASGCEEFLKIIQQLDNCNVFVISHKSDVLQDKFRSSIRFQKTNNFSRIA